MHDPATVVRQWIEMIWNAGDLDQIDRFHPPVFENEGQPSTPTEARAWHEEMRITFPDLHYQIEDLFVAEDRVIVRWRARATHQGLLWGFLAPTGREVEWPGMHIVRLDDEDQIVEIWAVANQATILRQIGVQLIPPVEE